MNDQEVQMLVAATSLVLLILLITVIILFVFFQKRKLKFILEKKEALAKKLDAEIAAEVYPFQKFWVGEDYHQDFERLNPNHPYIRNVSIPRLKRFQAKFPELLKKNH